MGSMPGLGNERRSQSIRLEFLRLLAILLALALASSAVLIWATYNFVRDQAKRQMIDTTRALAEVVDGAFARDDAMLRALAASPSTLKRDWPAVRRQALAVMRDPDTWIVVGDRMGRQFVNTRLPEDAVLPHGVNPAWIWPQLDKWQTHICDLTHGLVEPNILCVDVPVVIAGRTEYYLSVVMRPRALARLFYRQHLPPDWYYGVLDSRGTIAWHSSWTHNYIGTRATAAFFAATKTKDAGVLNATSFDGVPTYAAFSRSPVSHWYVVVGAPRKHFDRAVLPAILGSVVTVLVLMLVGGLLVLQWTQAVARGVENLAAQARALGSREQFTVPETRITEFAEISATLSQAEENLAHRDRQLEALTVSQAQRIETALAERETALAQLHEAQKLETLGQLTGGVAHDFNNLLTPIMGALDLLHRRCAEDAKAVRLIDAALSGAERAKILVARLLSFARRQALRPRAVDVGALVDGMTDFLRHSLGSAVIIRMETPVGRAIAHVDPNQLEMAILNLAVNARDAMPAGGVLTIAVCDADAAGSGLPPGEYIRVSVSDTGGGMDEATRLRAIEPFFTTKEHGRGTGLGLSMVHGLAAQSGGAFQISSEPGQGTRIDLWLPASDQNVREPQPHLREPAGPIRRGQGRILVVDDEVLIRAGTAELLGEIGYDVVQADSASEALGRLRTDKAIDAMVTDYMMPVMNGAALILEVRKFLPALPIVLITGYATPDLDVPEDIVRLAKPFRQKHIAESLNVALAQGAGLAAAND